MRLYWLLATFVSSILLAVLHTWASYNSIYWQWRWFDTPMHVLGGFTVGALLISVLGYWYRPRTFIIVATCIFIAWEVFEFLIGDWQPTPYLFDTLHDLVCDGIGATLAYLLARETIWHSS